MADKPKYYVGLDCGVGSVGWAVTDERYRLLKASGKTMWGSRLFKEASTAAKRRSFRASRRRKAREQRRIKLLQWQLGSEIAKVDPDFYVRIKLSNYTKADKASRSGGRVTNSVLLNGANGWTDARLHRRYPTIWHLRKAIIDNTAERNADGKIDIRLYYLAIEHILKHRGHFLRSDSLGDADVPEFEEVWSNFLSLAEEMGVAGSLRLQSSSVKGAMVGKNKLGRKDQVKMLADIFRKSVEPESTIKDEKELANLIVGYSCNLGSLFYGEKAGQDDDGGKVKFDDGKFEENAEAVGEYLSSVDGAFELVCVAKDVYDCVMLNDILGDKKTISSAMVARYEQHEADLKSIKSALHNAIGDDYKSNEDYSYFFKNVDKSHPLVMGIDDKMDASGANTGKDDEKKPKDELRAALITSYTAYVGHAYVVEGGRMKRLPKPSQEDINKKLSTIFKKYDIDKRNPDLYAKAEAGVLLPKQRGANNGVIPQQLHGRELSQILARLVDDYPQYEAALDKNGAISARVQMLHDFKIPYYCGPMRTKSSKTGKDGFCWAEEVDQTIYPWNYDEALKSRKPALANAFIRRMTNQCTYLYGEETLPKFSPMYQEFMVLNEINNIKINGKRIDQETKRKIYERAFKNNELSGSYHNTAKGLRDWICDNKDVAGENVRPDEIGGLSEEKTLPRLSTVRDFKKMVGCVAQGTVEKAVEYITILGNDHDILVEKLQELMGCDAQAARKLVRKHYSGWGKLSCAFLTCIKAPVDNLGCISILDALRESTHNLMELLSDDYEFSSLINERNEKELAKVANDKSIKDEIDNLYCSPAVKRSVRQAFKILKEIKTAEGYAPAKIFLEATRGGKRDDRFDGARKKRLQDKIKKVKKNNPDAEKLLSELDDKDDRSLQSDKVYLYYTQMGKCAYCGNSLSNSAVEIDHIIPRSKTGDSDDSVMRNKVLVCRDCNQDKKDIYPLVLVNFSRSSGVKNMHSIWAGWLSAKLITQEKYDRLVRTSPLTEKELKGFAARSLVETGQSVIAIRDLLQRHYKDTKVVLVKAGNVSKLRQLYGSNGSSKYGIRVMPEFIKIRELNNLHHAKDAYLNIVVGNVVSSTFTDKYGHPNYNVSSQDHVPSISQIFRGVKNYSTKDGRSVYWPKIADSAWEYDKSINVISATMRHDDIQVTQMLRTGAAGGGYWKQNPLGKRYRTKISDSAKDALIEIKKGMDTASYGGYNAAGTGHFALIGNGASLSDRMLVQIPIYMAKESEEFIKENYGEDYRVILDKIKVGALFNVDGVQMRLVSKYDDGKNTFSPITNFALPYDLFFDDHKETSLRNKWRMGKVSAIEYAKRVSVAAAKVSKSKTKRKKSDDGSADDGYHISEGRDGITIDENRHLLNIICEIMEHYCTSEAKFSFNRRLKKLIDKLDLKNESNSKGGAQVGDLDEQCIEIANLIAALSDTANAHTAFGVKKIGPNYVSNSLKSRKIFKIVPESTTGLYNSKPIDLLTVQPGEVKF